MNRFLFRIRRIVALSILNTFLCGTHYFGLKRVLLHLANVEVGNNTKVVGPLYLGGVASFKLGSNVWIGRNAAIDGNGTVEIGDFVDVGPCVSFGTGGHLIAGHDHRAGDGTASRITVGSGTWIGQNSLIINNSSIGKGCVIAAGSVVIGDMPDDVLVAGVPAKTKRSLQ